MVLPAKLQEEILIMHHQIISSCAFAAVRSSAVGEDASGVSFAGMHDSCLFVRQKKDIFAAILKVWASLYNERALAYRLFRGLSLENMRMAVVVQKMINAKSSGVMFTVNPSAQDVHEVVISSLFGLGEGLVSEGLDADTYIVQKKDLSTDINTAEKQEQMILAHPETGGIKRSALPEALKEQPSLTEKQCQEIARNGLLLEKKFGRPQDVEFALDDQDNLYFLQTRPITTAAEYGPAAGHRLIWDNSNIIESYSGVTSPMTFSFIKRAYTIVYHCFAQVMGIPEVVVKKNQTTFENMLGLFRGRVYYNLVNWYRLARLFPGFQYNQKFMESMMGLKEPAELKDEKSAPNWFKRMFVELPALLGLILRSVVNFMNIDKITKEFDRHFARHYNHWISLEIKRYFPQQLMALYREMENNLLWNWKAPIINDFYVMIFYGILKKLCNSWCLDTNGSLQNDLLCGEGNIESTQPTKKLLQLAKQAQKDTALKERLLTHSPDELVFWLQELDENDGFKKAVYQYLQLYGFRCMNELKLEEPTLRDQPQFIFQVLKNYLKSDDPEIFNVEARESKEREMRRAAEQKAFTAIKKNKGFLPRGVFFRWVLKNARKGVKNRENMRFARSKIYGLLRELLKVQGTIFARENIIQQPEDIFYLTIDEVWDYIKGTAVSVNLRGLIGVRQAEYATYRQEEDLKPDDRFETYGMAYHTNRFKNRHIQSGGQDADGLKGIGCCPGKISQVIKIVRNPSEDVQLNGEILVAERTDPGWIPLYPSISGLLIERGSILSHSAIVAREMGIPTIVGIPNLIANLKNGQWVEMDGSQGTVKLLTKAANELSTLE
jgi:pyruvate,water dikinase